MKPVAKGLVGGPIDILRDILIREMELAKDRVVVYNQKLKIPEDEFLFVVVEYKFSKTLSNRSVVFTSGSTSEIQDVNMQEFYTIGIFSSNLEALQRKEEVVMALGSQYSQQMQEKNSFQISRVNPIQDVTDLEPTALLYRFDIDIVVAAWYTKTKAADYYNQFTGEIHTEQLEVDFTQDIPE